MTTLESDFEDTLREVVLDEAEKQAPEIGEELMEIAEEKWRQYAKANDYDIDHVWRDAEGPDVTRGDREVRIQIRWPFSSQFEFGVDPHVIEASDADMLAFPWPEMEGVEFGNTGQTFDEVFEETWPIVFFPEVDWGSESGGIPKARAVRDSLRELRGELQ